jgi:hypothetical protein
VTARFCERLLIIALFLTVVFTSSPANAVDVCYQLPFSNPNLADGWGSTCCGRTSPHRGVDFPQPTGTKIPSVADGVVVRVTWTNCLGNVVVVKHPDGMYSGYCHLSAALVSPGQGVSKGQHIAAVGNTGTCTTGPHLHLTMSPEETGYMYGTTVDPYAYIKAHEQCCVPKAEVCNGQDDDCNGQADEGDICVLEQLIVPQMGALDMHTSDLDGDRVADVCARSSAGITCQKSSGGKFAEAVVGPALSNDNGWAHPKYYATIRMADVNGDGKADICARHSAGFSCWLADGSSFAEQIDGPEWSDAKGWGETRFWSTLRLPDIDGDGKTDVCARAAAGIVCHKSTGTGFGEQIAGPELSDANGWGSEKYYATLRFADVNGDGMDDVCARHSVGFSCWLSDGNGFPTEIAGPELGDANGWGVPKHWATIRMGDVDGDGKADVCARAIAGMRCWLSDGTNLASEVVGPELSDAKGWGDVSYWSTLRLVDINADHKADVCARAAAGFHCWLSSGDGFGDSIVGPDMGDPQGWNKPEYYGTFRVADVTGDGKADVCGRGLAGIVCFPFDGSAFGAQVTGPAWSDASGWNTVQYYSTLQAAGGCVSRSETCNAKDDDCDGQVDEDGVCDNGLGGASAGSGGSGSGSGWSGSQNGGGSATNGADSEAESEGGCGCRFAPSPVGAGWAALAFGGLLWFCRRNRRR